MLLSPNDFLELALLTGNGAISALDALHSPLNEPLGRKFA